MKKFRKKFYCIFLCYVLFIGVFPVNVNVKAETKKDVTALTYHVGAYDIFPENDGRLSVTIDDRKYYYSDDFDAGDIGTKLSKMENQNVVYE